ncbi:MAG: polysaccharide deacetylase family protein [Chloroherpetonaceae bacterium]|nr:polysaccharide deacetylase family protein [Chloroherpetonaceae bacterium]MDW8437801.1 polysaccharide deacetylase family protein [Chloroherpetonaceae bacterium]
MNANLLSYHKVTDRLDFGVTTRTLADFRADVAFIRSLPESQRPEICFDDGYEDAFENAFPILAESELVANLFVITGVLGRRNVWDFTLFGEFKHLTKAQVRELSDAGWRVGSHSKSHLALTTLSVAALRAELRDSKKFLEDLLGKRVTTISFPFGNFDERVVEECKAAGYEEAISIKKPSQDGFVKRSKAVYRFDSLNAIRAKLRNDPLELFRLRVINACSRATILMHRLKGYKPIADAE